MKQFVLLGCLLAVSTSAFGASLILNGGFETGDFTGWTASILNTSAYISSLTTLSHNFIAASDLTTLTFKDDTNNNSYNQDGYLDAISVTAATPEPGGFVLLGSGLLAVYPFLRSRRRRD